MEVSYPRARTMSWFRDLMVLALAYPNLFGTKDLVVVVVGENALERT